MSMKASLSFATFIIQNLFTTLLNTFAKIVQLIKTKSLQYGMPGKFSPQLIFDFWGTFVCKTVRNVALKWNEHGHPNEISKRR